MDAIEGWLYRQRRRIQRLHQVQFGVDVVEPMFSNELRAYYNRRRRWTTQVHFGHLHHHNHMHPQGNPHMQDSQNSPPTQQDTEVNQQSMHVQESHFPSHIENDHPSAPQNTPTQAEQVHASLNSAIHSLLTLTHKPKRFYTTVLPISHRPSKSPLPLILLRMWSLPL